MAGEADGARVVLLGAPGSGKGTQAVRLSARLGVPAISTGEMLRVAVADGSPLGRRVQGVMAAGKFVDDDLMADVVRLRLVEDDARSGFLLDGYPRTTSQAETLTRLLCEQGAELDAVLLLEVPESILVERARGRGREDDRSEVVRERLRLYREKTEPLADHYRQRGLLRAVNGNQSMETVTEALLGALRESRRRFVAEA